MCFLFFIFLFLLYLWLGDSLFDHERKDENEKKKKIDKKKLKITFITAPEDRIQPQLQLRTFILKKNTL